MKFNKKHVLAMTLSLTIVALFFQNCSRTGFTSVAKSETADAEQPAETSNTNQNNPNPAAAAAPNLPSGTPTIPASGSGGSGGSVGSANCIAQSFSWSVGSSTCSVQVSALSHGANNVAVNDSEGSATGSARINCTNGFLSLNSGIAATCSTTVAQPQPDLKASRPMFSKSVYKKGVDAQAFIGTGYHVSQINNLKYCIQKLGESNCYTPSNFVPVNANSPAIVASTVTLGIYLTFDNFKGKDFLGEGEVILIINLNGIASGSYQVFVEPISYIFGFGWGNGSNDMIQVSPGIGTLLD